MVVHKRSLGTFFLVACLSIGSIRCSDDNLGPTEPADTNPYEFTDEQILDLIYSDYKYTDDFYQENLQGASIYYVNTVSILPVEERETIWFQLCTDDRDTALAWSESSSVNSSYYRDLVLVRETEKYFEFRRVYSKNPDDIILDRVHKYSYLDRSMYDRLNPGPILGIFNVRPLTSEGVRSLIEYLWFVEHYEIRGAKVLFSSNSESDSVICQTILHTHFGGGDWGMCDKISVIKSTYNVKRTSGAITVEAETVRVITGHCH